VRVAGYCAYFDDLPDSAKAEIISRPVCGHETSGVSFIEKLFKRKYLALTHYFPVSSSFRKISHRYQRHFADIF